MSRHQEWHVTVAPDNVIVWNKFCRLWNIKPLYIELNNFNRQLMCAASFDPITIIREGGYEIIRIKHEVSAVLPGDTTCYWECHVKLNGEFNADAPMASRDLYRQFRWYVTKREYAPFDAQDFANYVIQSGIGCMSDVAEFEYEACLLDTNPSLDAGWR